MNADVESLFICGMYVNENTVIPEPVWIRTGCNTGSDTYYDYNCYEELSVTLFASKVGIELCDTVDAGSTDGLWVEFCGYYTSGTTHNF